MKINYVSLGSLSYLKNILRESNREYLESLPFDFHSLPNLSGVTHILKELYEKKTYDINLTEIISIYDDNLVVSEENDIYLVHFFKKEDLIENIKDFPAPLWKIKKDVLIQVKKKMKRRYERLYRLLQSKNEIICFLRIEEDDNPLWEQQLHDLCEVLSLYKNNNKYLLYSQNSIDSSLDFYSSNQFNYQYHIPVLFFKQSQFNNHLLESFEKLMNDNENIITLSYQNQLEKYYVDPIKKKIFKMTNLNSHSDCFLENDLLILNNALTGNNIFKKNSHGIYIEDS